MKSVIVAFSAFLFFLAVPVSALTMSEAETLISLLKLNSEQTKLIRAYASIGAVGVKIVDGTMTGKILDTDIDKVGGKGVFKANNAADFNWSIILDLTEDKKIEKISLIHDVNREVWSTGASKFIKYNNKNYQFKDPNPLVVFDERMKTRYVSSYDEEFKLSQGTHELRLFGQKETEVFAGGTAIVQFTDRTQVSTYIKGI